MDSGGNNYRRGGGSGGGRGRGRAGGRVNYQSQGAGGRGWDAPQRQFHDRPPTQQQWVQRPPVQGYSGANRPPPLQTPQSQRLPYQGVVPAGGRGGGWAGKPSAQSHASSSAPAQTFPAPPLRSSSDLVFQPHKIPSELS